jgi:hypothetical protein
MIEISEDVYYKKTWGKGYYCADCERKLKKCFERGNVYLCKGCNMIVVLRGIPIGINTSTTYR